MLPAIPARPLPPKMHLPAEAASRNEIGLQAASKSIPYVQLRESGMSEEIHKQSPSADGSSTRPQPENLEVPSNQGWSGRKREASKARPDSLSEEQHQGVRLAHLQSWQPVSKLPELPLAGDEEPRAVRIHPLVEEPQLLPEEPRPLIGEVQLLPFHAPEGIPGIPGRREDMLNNQAGQVLFPRQPSPPVYGSSRDTQPSFDSETADTRSLQPARAGNEVSADSEELTSFIMGSQMRPATAAPAADDSTGADGQDREHKKNSEGNMSLLDGKKEGKQQEVPPQEARRKSKGTTTKGYKGKARKPKAHASETFRNLADHSGAAKRAAMLQAAEDLKKSKKLPVR